MLVGPLHRLQRTLAGGDEAAWYFVVVPPRVPQGGIRVDALQVLVVAELAIHEVDVALEADGFVTAALERSQAGSVDVDRTGLDLDETQLRERIPHPCTVDRAGDPPPPVRRIENHRPADSTAEMLTTDVV